MKELLVFMRQHLVWLHQILVEYHLIYIDLWSLVHFWSGIVIFSCITALQWKNRWRWIFFFLTMFEVVEAFVFIGILRLFQPEKIPDVFMDIIIGMGGGYFTWLFFEKYWVKRKERQLIAIFLSSLSLAFVWTGFYGYRFNQEFFNYESFNFIVFLVWTGIGVLTLTLYHFLKKRYTKAYQVGLTYLFFLLLIVFLQFMAHMVFKVNEVAHAYPIRVFGFFEVNMKLVCFYLLVPMLNLLLAQWFFHLFSKHTQAVKGHEELVY